MMSDIRPRRDMEVVASAERKGLGQEKDIRIGELSPVD